MIEELRYERKYKLERVNLQAVVAEVRCHPYGFKRHHPDRHINNIYFDTPELHTFNENLSGAAQRHKFRLRWYGGDMTKITNARWEIKSKLNTLGRKTVVRFAGTHAMSDLRAISRVVNRQYHYGELLAPALINSYQRSYFISQDRHYRLTVDRDLHYFPVRGENRFTRYALEDQGVIIELKYDQLLDEEAAELLRYMPYTQTKSSKYVTGILMSA